MEPRTLDRYPASTMLLSNAVALSIYAIGVYVLSGLSPWTAVLYVGYCLWIEFRILKKSCMNCCYYGNWCGLG